MQISESGATTEATEAAGPIHILRWIMSAPTASGVSGDGGLGRGRILGDARTSLQHLEKPPFKKMTYVTIQRIWVAKSFLLFSDGGGKRREGIARL